MPGYDWRDKSGRVVESKSGYNKSPAGRGSQNQGTRQSSFDSKSGTSGSANTGRYWQKEEDEAWEIFMHN